RMSWLSRRWILSFQEWRRLLIGCWPERCPIRIETRYKKAGRNVRPFVIYSFENLSDSHRHYDVPVFVFAIGGLIRTKLARRLGILKFKSNVTRSYYLQEFEQILGIKSNDHWIASVAGFNRVFRF